MKHPVARGECRLSGWGLLGTFCVITFPSTNERMRDVWSLVGLTCPCVAGRHYAISFYEALAVNTVTYALVGLFVETLRGKSIHSKV